MKNGDLVTGVPEDPNGTGFFGNQVVGKYQKNSFKFMGETVNQEFVVCKAGNNEEAWLCCSEIQAAPQGAKETVLK